MNNDGNSVSIEISKDALKGPEEQDMETEWNSLPAKLRAAYRMRLETERHLRDYFKNRTTNEDYVPTNEYGEFIKKEVETGRVKKCNNRFFYEVFQKWLREKKLVKRKQA